MLTEFVVQNTQNKVYNNKRRTYIDKSDCKEGEVICKKCMGAGELIPRDSHFRVDICSQCLGRGIVDWITQAVERPPLNFTDSSSSSSISSRPVKKTIGASVHSSPKPVKFVANSGMIGLKQVTNYKRRKVV